MRESAQSGAVGDDIAADGVVVGAAEDADRDRGVEHQFCGRWVKGCVGSEGGAAVGLWSLFHGSFIRHRLGKCFDLDGSRVSKTIAAPTDERVSRPGLWRTRADKPSSTRLLAHRSEAGPR